MVAAYETLEQVSGLLDMTGDSMLERGQLPEGGAALKLLAVRITDDIARVRASENPGLTTFDPTVAPLLEGIVRALRARKGNEDTLSSLALAGVIGRTEELAQSIRLAHGDEAIARAMALLSTPGAKIEEVRALIGRLQQLITPAGDSFPEEVRTESPALRALVENATTAGGATFEKFTDRARKALALANQEAQRLNHEYIGTEHILLGIVKDGAGLVAPILRARSLDLQQARLAVEQLASPGPEMVTMGKLPMTPRAKKVMEFAVTAARDFNHSSVTTAHLLIGLLAEKNGVAEQVLRNFGFKFDSVYEEVRTSDSELSE
jgi:hypothetical protein